MGWDGFEFSEYRIPLEVFYPIGQKNMRLSLIFCFKNVHTGTKESTRYTSGAHVYLHRDPKRRLLALKKAHACRMKKKLKVMGYLWDLRQFLETHGMGWETD